MTAPITLSIDAMGGDDGAPMVIEGLDLFRQNRREGVRFILHGDEEIIRPLLDARPKLAVLCELHHTDKSVSMDDKPGQIARRAKGTSMGNAVDSVKSGAAQAAVSAGNTGALMAVAMMTLKRQKGVKRPGMTALWPTPKGMSVVLDVGANMEADAEQLLKLAIMGEAYARAISGKARPSIGLLNIGTEDTKGPDRVKLAAKLIADPIHEFNFAGFVEGNDISEGTVDVVVTDGYAGNIALKTAEGTARLVGGYVRSALKRGLLTRLGAVIAISGLKWLKHEMNPSRVNGGVLLGLNGVVVKSHGGTDAEGFANAIQLAANLSVSDYANEVAQGLARISAMEETPVADGVAS
ncbi:MAG: phosphate acyltransferase PlsX [Pseudomonadota bacterium]